VSRGIDEEPHRPDSGEDRHATRPPGPQLGRQMFLWVVIIGAVLVTLLFIKKWDRPVQKAVELKVFEKHLAAGDVEEIVIKGNRVTGALKPNRAPYQKVKVTVNEGYLEASVIDRWKEKVDRLKFEESSMMLPIIAVQVLPMLLLVGILVYYMNRQMRMMSSRDGGFPFLKSGARLAEKEKTGITFADVAGVDEAKEELLETVEFLRNPAKFRTIGGRIPRGILLVGAPGTGKTLLAKAVAGEADVPFFSMCGSDFVELFVGVGAARVRDLFQTAREHQPCIIFLDEIDAVGRKRGTGLGGGHDEREQTLNAILADMDGFSRDDGIIVLAATNRPDVLDPALQRPGRFDRQIVVDMPDLNGRKAILEIHARKIKLAPNVNLGILARGTPGFNGADLEAVINEAALRASTKNKQWVEIDDLEEARDKVRFGRQKKSRVMTDEDRRMTAYHEAGHAIVALLHPDVEPLHKVTIVPRGLSLGMTMILPETDKYGLRKRECRGILTLRMAGRVAEEMFCHDISSGAKDDIEGATELARKMVTQWGMSDKLGPVCYSDEEEHVFLGSEITRAKKHGEQISQQIDEEVRSLLHQAHAEATQMLQQRAKQVEAVAEALLQLETLTSEEAQAIVDGKTTRELLNQRAVEETKRVEAVQESRQMPEGGTSAGDVPAPEGSPA